jgi:hypothetical protein
MFCPTCKAGYRDGFTECADCQIPLVDSLEALAPKNDLDLADSVVAYVTPVQDEANALKERLEANGIPVSLFDNKDGTVHPYSNHGASGVILLVPGAQLQPAQEIIETYLDENEESAEDESSEEPNATDPS